MKRLTKIFDRVLILYAVLGLLNYLVCNWIMLYLHNGLGVEKNLSLIIEFTLQTANSFLLNRYVTFRGIPISRRWPLRFVLSVGTSYLIAKVLLYRVFEYLITLPFFLNLSEWLRNLVTPAADGETFRRSLVMLACTMTYCAINYIGQRYFVFRPVQETAGQTV